MNELYEKLRKKICSCKNQQLDETISNINDEVYTKIHENMLGSIEDLTDQYDSIIDKEAPHATDQTLSHLYKMCYEGFKANSLFLVGTILSSQNH